MKIQKENAMTAQAYSHESAGQKTKVIYRGGASEAVYGLGLLGAWFYYLTNATSIGMGVLGIVKGVFWPALMVYEVLKYLNL
jgi:hypothetical protein